jgi:hypothetical protein
MVDSVQLSPREYIILASALGGETFLGFDDPFKGFLQEEVDGLVEVELIPALIKRGILQSNSEGNYQLRSDVEAMLASAAFPTITFVLSYRHKGDALTERILFHVDGRRIIEQQEDGDALLLEALDVEDLGEYFSDLFGLGSQPPPAEEPFILSREMLHEASLLVRSEGDKSALEYLVSSGLSEAIVKSFANTLSTSKTDGVLVGIQHTADPWAVNGFAFIEGSNGLWLIHQLGHGEDHSLQMEPCSGDLARERLKNWLQTLMA